MEVDTVVVGQLEENCYIISKDGQCLVIDPGDEIDKIKANLKDLEILQVLITHYHFDHVGALTYFNENLILKDPKEKEYKIGPFTFKVIYTKGHTSDSVTYYFEKEKLLFTGDFLFKESIGRTDLPTGDYEEMIHSIEKIKTYPNDLKVYPGHGDSTTLGYEKENNYYLKTNVD